MEDIQAGTVQVCTEPEPTVVVETVNVAVPWVGEQVEEVTDKHVGALVPQILLAVAQIFMVAAVLLNVIVAEVVPCPAVTVPLVDETDQL
jgi:hypothetical protein